jgi:hypothetical protein
LAYIGQALFYLEVIRNELRQSTPRKMLFSSVIVNRDSDQTTLSFRSTDDDSRLAKRGNFIESINAKAVR